jgi:ATP-dependent Lhr-like helicase
LSATIGNPDAVLAWLTTGCTRPAHCLNPAAAALAAPEITLDYVGSLDNAALVISRLHRGEKRLVFVDSRARAERLAAVLRSLEVTTLLSHGSLSADERRRAEHAFAEARDCVIVATSTLELGIDVGDLDRVVQIDAPPTVAALLQRLGRTGRRPGAVRNVLVLATSDDALVRAAAVLWCWSTGYVEPIVPPPAPYHLVAQQCLALTLQEGQIGRHLWVAWLGHPFALGPDAETEVDAVTSHLVDRGFLLDGGSGLLAIGTEAEAAYGRRHFLELLAAFTSPPVLTVRHGRTEIGLVPDATVARRAPGGGPAVLLLAGRSWLVRHVDWRRRTVDVEPVDAPGAARWSGAGQPLGGRVADGVRDVLAGTDPAGVEVGRRATERLAALRDVQPWVRPGATFVVTAADQVRWWTFAGSRCNASLADALAGVRLDVTAFNDLWVGLNPGTTAHAVRVALDSASGHMPEPPVEPEALEGLKFSDCLPSELAYAVLRRRLVDADTWHRVIGEPVVAVHEDGR